MNYPPEQRSKAWMVFFEKENIKSRAYSHWRQSNRRSAWRAKL